MRNRALPIPPTLLTAVATPVVRYSKENASFAGAKASMFDTVEHGTF
jgi:hypothetical protein